MAHGIEERVAHHYERGDLEQAILDALVASGKDVDHLAPDDLSPVDEFHAGGRQATVDFAAEIGFAPGMPTPSPFSSGATGGCSEPLYWLSKTCVCRKRSFELLNELSTRSTWS